MTEQNTAEQIGKELAEKFDRACSTARQNELLAEINERLKLLGGQTPQEMLDQADPEMQELIALRAIEKMSLTEVYEFVKNDPRQIALRKAKEAADEQVRVRNAKLVAEVVG